VTNNTNARTAQSSTVKTDVTIGTIQVNAPNATNSREIAGSIGNDLRSLDLGAQTNYGLA
jgi:hypothetical protein